MVKIVNTEKICEIQLQILEHCKPTVCNLGMQTLLKLQMFKNAIIYSCIQGSNITIKPKLYHNVTKIIS